MVVFFAHYEKYEEEDRKDIGKALDYKYNMPRSYINIRTIVTGCP